jgi:putative PIN family toxin of toxin-antitoxin system
MKHRVVYDTMVLYQWAVLPTGRLHRTARAVMDDQVMLCLSDELLREVADLLDRPAIRAKSRHLTSERIAQFLKLVSHHAEVIAAPPEVFTWPEHPDDDHIFNLTIAAKARYLVTWENRLLNILRGPTSAADSLRALAPQLEIITPAALAEELRKNAGREAE